MSPSLASGASHESTTSMGSLVALPPADWTLCWRCGQKNGATLRVRRSPKCYIRVDFRPRIREFAAAVLHQALWYCKHMLQKPTCTALLPQSAISVAELVLKVQGTPPNYRAISRSQSSTGLVKGRCWRSTLDREP
jgi:hypothetical protein